MAINKLPTIPKHLLDPTAAVLPITGSVTYPGSGGSFAVPNNIGGVPISNGSMPPFNLTDHTIQGKMITVAKTIDHFIMEQVDENDIKISMMSQLVEEMIKNKCVEFTKQRGESTNETIIRARIFVTPDTNIRIIREYQK